MCNIEILHFGDPAKACNLAVDAVKAAVRCEQALPGILLITRHVVVGVVACHDHEGTENDLLISGVFDLFDDVFAGGLFRLTFHSTDEGVLIAKFLHLGLHLAVSHLCGMCCAMSQEYKCGSVFFCCLEAFKAGCLNSFFHNCLGDSCLVLVDHGLTLTDFPQKRLRDADSRKVRLNCFDSGHKFIIFSAVHQVCGLNSKIFDAVFLCAGQCLFDVVDDFAVTGLNVVDDDLSSESSADRPVRICCLQGLLDAADVGRAAVIKGCTEADDQHLVISDLIRIERIIQRGVACVAAEIIGIRRFAFHHSLLLIRQGIPGSLCCSDVFVRRLCALLHINLVDQSCALCRKLLIRLICCLILLVRICLCLCRIRIQGCVFHGICCVRDINRLYIRDPSKTGNLAVDAVKAAVRREQALPGILFVTCHVVVGVVACDDHEGTENNLFISGFFDLFDDVFTGGLFRLAFNRSDEDVLVAQIIHLVLHLAVGHLGGMCCAMSHEYKCGSVFFCCLEAFKSGHFHGFFNHCLGDSFLVLINDCFTLTDFPQKGLRDDDILKVSPDSIHCCRKLVILCAVHQVRGLNDKIFDTVFLCAGQCLVDVVDGFVITGLHVVDDDLRGKCSAHGPVGVGFLQGLLNAADVGRTALVKGSAEADDKQLVLSDLIRIEWIVRRGISGIAAEVVGIRLFAFHQSLLRICQSIPCSSRRSDVVIRCLCALLHIDLVDQSCALCRKLLICFGCLCRRGCR